MATRTISNAGGNWNATGTWVEGAVPTAADDVVATGTSGNVTINATAACRSADFTNYVGVLTHNAAIVWSIGTSTVNGTTALKFVAGMTYTLGNAATSEIDFISTSATQLGITTAGKVLGNVVFNATSNGSWILLDAMTATGGTITLTKGTFNTGGFSVTCSIFASNNSNTRALTFGASTITVTAGSGTNAWNLATVTGLTFNAGSSTIVMTGRDTFQGGGLTYTSLTINAPSSGLANVPVIKGTNIFVNLTFTGTGLKTDGCQLAANQTVTGALTINGNSSVNRYWLISDTLGTQRTITTTGATVTMNNVDFRDIVLSVTFNAAAFSVGDCGGNSGITFPTGQTNYWVGNAGNYSDVTHWASSSGGSGSSGRVPLPQDNVRFDANSFSSSAQIATGDMPRCGANIDWTGVTNTPQWKPSTNQSSYGSITLVSGMTVSSASAGTYTFEGRSSCTLTCAGQTFPLGSTGLFISMVGGTLTLQDALTLTSFRNLTVTNGTFDANGFNVSVNGFVCTGTATRVVKMGAGTWTCNAAGTPWNINNTGVTLTASTSTIVLSDITSSSKTFVGGGLTYNNFTLPTGGTGAIIIQGSNTFNVFTVNAPKVVQFTSGTTQTITSFVPTGSVSGSIIALSAVTASSTATLSQASGIVSGGSDFMTITDITGSGGASWLAGHNSTLLRTSGWTTAALYLIGGVTAGGVTVLIAPLARVEVMQSTACGSAKAQTVLGRLQVMAASVGGQAQTNAVMGAIKVMAGSVAGQASAVAKLYGGKPLCSETAGVGSASTVLYVLHVLAGSTGAQSQAESVLIKTGVFLGSTKGQASLAAVLNRIRTLGGVTSGKSRTSVKFVKVMPQRGNVVVSSKPLFKVKVGDSL